MAEKMVMRGLGVEEVLLRVPAPSATLLLFRSGELNRASSAVVIGAEVLVVRCGTAPTQVLS